MFSVVWGEEVKGGGVIVVWGGGVIVDVGEEWGWNMQKKGVAIPCKTLKNI